MGIGVRLAMKTRKYGRHFNAGVDNQIKVTNFMDEIYNDSMCGLQKLTIRPIKHLNIIDQSIEYTAEFLTARDTPHHATLANWIEA